MTKESSIFGFAFRIVRTAELLQRTKKLHNSKFLVRPARHREPLRRGGRVFDIQEVTINLFCECLFPLRPDAWGD
jgi:hypothetical protein